MITLASFAAKARLGCLSNNPMSRLAAAVSLPRQPRLPRPRSVCALARLRCSRGTGIPRQAGRCPAPVPPAATEDLIFVCLAAVRRRFASPCRGAVSPRPAAALCRLSSLGFCQSRIARASYPGAGKQRPGPGATRKQT